MAALWFGGRFLFEHTDIENGGINLQTVRHEEGKVIHCLKKHTSPVSVLQLASDQQSVLSGGWDRQVYVSLSFKSTDSTGMGFEYWLRSTFLR